MWEDGAAAWGLAVAAALFFRIAPSDGAGPAHTFPTAGRPASSSSAVGATQVSPSVRVIEGDTSVAPTEEAVDSALTSSGFFFCAGLCTGSFGATPEPGGRVATGRAPSPE